MVKLAQAFYYGRQLVADIIEAEEGEKTASEVRGNIEADMAVDEIKLAARYETMQDVYDWLKANGHDKVADDLANAAQEEADQLEAEPDPEAVTKAVEDGAAAQIAEATGKDPDDPEVQEAAQDVVAQAAAAIEQNADQQ